jgi:ABC-type phosphate transport system substrate-binding protein
VDIGATDAPLRPDAAAQLEGDFAQLPVTGGMIAITYNLPGLSGPLNLPRDVYADIFLGEIDRWDDPESGAGCTHRTARAPARAPTLARLRRRPTSRAIGIGVATKPSQSPGMLTG